MATKAEALAWLAIQPPINAVGEAKLTGTNSEFGDKIYMVNVRKIQGDCVRYENIQFVVINEGLPQEIAYFLGNNAVGWDNVHERPVVP